MTPTRLRQLEAFRAVMQSGSVSRAAQRMRLSQPAVTKLVRSLEEDTGLSLFDRSRRHLQPTPEAVRLEIAVARLFAAADGLDRAIDDMRGIGSGELRVAAMPLFGASLIPRLMSRFTRDIQPVRISLTVISSREVHDLVHAGDVDLGFALSYGERNMLVAAPPIQLPALLVLPRGHRLSDRDTVPVSELNGEPYVCLGRQYRLRDQVDELFSLNDVSPKLVAETQNTKAACAMVSEGLGFTVTDSVSALDFGRDLVVRRIEPTVYFSVNILSRPGQSLSASATRFVDMVLGHLRENYT